MPSDFVMKRISIIIVFLSWLRFISCNGFRILFPLEIKGIYYHIQASFGPRLDDLPFDGPYEVVLSDPDRGACTPLNHSKIHNNVVLIKRGASSFDFEINDERPQSATRCRFVTKVLQAQNAGAIAAIIGNDNGGHTIVPMYAESGISATETETIDDKYALQANRHNLTNASKVAIPSISVSQHTYNTMYKQLRGSAEKNFTDTNAVWIKLTSEGEMQVTATDNALQNWIEAIVSSLVLVGMMMLFISMLLSIRLIVARLADYYAQFRRRRALANIPIIRYEPPTPAPEAEALLSRRENVNSSNNINTDISDDQNDNHKELPSPATVDRLLSEVNDSPSNNINENSDNPGAEASETAKHPISFPSESPLPSNQELSNSVSKGYRFADIFTQISRSFTYLRSDSAQNLEKPRIHNDTCNVCLDEFEKGEKVKMLPCRHGYHNQCIEEWLITHGNCPVCKQSAF